MCCTDSSTLRHHPRHFWEDGERSSRPGFVPEVQGYSLFPRGRRVRTCWEPPDARSCPPIYKTSLLLLFLITSLSCEKEQERASRAQAVLPPSWLPAHRKSGDTSSPPGIPGKASPPPLLWGLGREESWRGGKGEGDPPRKKTQQQTKAPNSPQIPHFSDKESETNLVNKTVKLEPDSGYIKAFPTLLYVILPPRYVLNQRQPHHFNLTPLWVNRSRKD